MMPNVCFILVLLVYLFDIPTKVFMEENVKIKNCTDVSDVSCFAHNRKPNVTSDSHDYLLSFVENNKSVLYRSAVVLCSLTGVLTLFFIIKAVR